MLVFPGVISYKSELLRPIQAPALFFCVSRKKKLDTISLSILTPQKCLFWEPIHPCDKQLQTPPLEGPRILRVVEFLLGNLTKLLKMPKTRAQPSMGPVGRRDPKNGKHIPPKNSHGTCNSSIWEGQNVIPTPPFFGFSLNFSGCKIQITWIMIVIWLWFLINESNYLSCEVIIVLNYCTYNLGDTAEGGILKIKRHLRVSAEIDLEIFQSKWKLLQLWLSDVFLYLEMLIPILSKSHQFLQIQNGDQFFSTFQLIDSTWHD